MITVHYRSESDKIFQKLEKYRSGSWIHVEQPTEEELALLVRDFSLEEDLLHDALDPFEVSRLEEEKGKIYIFLEVPLGEKSGGASTQPILVIFTQNCILTVAQGKPELLERFFSGRREFFTTQKTRAFLQFLSEINEEYSRYLTKMAKEIRAVSANVESVRVETLVQFVAFEKTINDFLVALVPMRAILQTILTEKKLISEEEEKEYAEDIFLTIRQLIEISESMRKNIVNIRDASSLIMSHSLNRSIRMLTILTIILSVPMALGSLYGMNVPLPLSESQIVFWTIVGVSLLCMGVLFPWLIRKK